jgi:hypothetical protein
MTEKHTPALTKADLMAEMDAVWRELDVELEKFGDKLDTRMPVDGPSWTGRQLLGHMIGSLQTNPYYLMQASNGRTIETVFGDPYWQPIYATATISSFRAMVLAAHVGTVTLVEAADETDLARKTATAGGQIASALEIVYFNYHVHLRSHTEDLKRWNESVKNP